MKPSLLSASAGLAAGALTEMFVFAPFEAGFHISAWAGYVVIAMLYGAPLVGAVWLLFLWPLYARVPVTSILWSPAVCISAGAVAGGALYFISSWLIFRFPSVVLLSFSTCRSAWSSVESRAPSLVTSSAVSIHARRLTNRCGQPLTD
jgi:hypothetical protein